MAMSAVKQQAFFIKQLEENLNHEEAEILVEYDPSETEDLIATKATTSKVTDKPQFCCCDQSETETLISSQ